MKSMLGESPETRLGSASKFLTAKFDEKNPIGGTYKINSTQIPPRLDLEVTLTFLDRPKVFHAIP